jgi:hypothetical protein
VRLSQINSSGSWRNIAITLIDLGRPFSMCVIAWLRQLRLRVVRRHGTLADFRESDSLNSIFSLEASKIVVFGYILVLLTRAAEPPASVSWLVPRSRPPSRQKRCTATGRCEPT